MGMIADLQKSINAWAVRKEWRGPNATPRPLGIDLMLWTTEIAEAFEELRKTEDPHHTYVTWTAILNGVKFKDLSDEQLEAMREAGAEIPDQMGKPEGFGPETADLMIRVLETCEEYGIDLEAEIERKMAFNEQREIRHGGLLM